jgi:hypothetical protein
MNEEVQHCEFTCSPSQMGHTPPHGKRGGTRLERRPFRRHPVVEEGAPLAGDKWPRCIGRPRRGARFACPRLRRGRSDSESPRRGSSFASERGIESKTELDSPSTTPRKDRGEGGNDGRTIGIIRNQSFFERKTEHFRKLK